MITSLKTPREFKTAMHRGKRCETPYFTLIFSDFETIAPRYGLTVSKKMGNAVARNRIKRRYRALLIECEVQLPNRDFVFLARRKALTVDFAEMKRTFEDALKSM